MVGTIVSIAGISSEVGKTTLRCVLLRELPGWEAVKLTRGHYRTCGNDPHACCVSHLLSDEPAGLRKELSVYYSRELPQLIARIKQIHSARSITANHLISE